LDIGKIHALRGYAQASKAIVGVAYYVVLNCDEVSIVDNQSWLFVYYYVVEN